VIKIPELRSRSDLGGKDNLVPVSDECERLFKATVKEIEESHLEVMDEWIEENDPERARELIEAEDEMNRVWRANIEGKSTISEFKLALRQYFEANRRVNKRHK
jgi:hypothetical protein